MSERWRRGRRWCAMLALALQAGCAGASAADWHTEEPAMTRDEDSASLIDEQLRHERAWSEELARPEPDCTRARELRMRICDLASRICAIADRRRADRTIADHCTDARGRCDGATQRTAERCPDSSAGSASQ